MATSFTPGEFQAADAAISAASAATTNKQSDDNTNAGTNNAAATDPMNINFGYERMSGQKSSATLVDKLYPGARKRNPLDYFSSYNYQITLYVVSAEGHNAYIKTGRLPQKPGNVAIVAQSGGINNNAELRAMTKTGNIGPGQTGLDYFIDSLEFTTTPNISGGQANISITDVTLKIIEPVGFSFVNQLKLAVNKISDPSATNFSGQGSADAASQPFSNKFILAIRFYGYDVNGNLVTEKSDIVKRFSNGTTTEDGVIERYVPVTIAGLTFKLDGNATVYSISLNDTSTESATGTLNGYIQQSSSLVATTVSEALNGGSGPNEKGLMGALNSYEQEKKDKEYIDIPVTYEVEFLDENNNPDPNGPIASARLESNVVAENAPMSPASATTDATIKESIRASSFDTVKKTLSFTNGIPIITMIDNVISKSEYVTAALNARNDQDSETKTQSSITKSKFQWYSINPVVILKGRDQRTNNWSYHIKYQIKPFTIYYNNSVNVRKGSYSNYPGPFKLYSYVMTGENTEVLSFDMELNNQWFAPYNFSISNNVVPTSRIADIQTPVSVQNGSQSDTTGIGINNSTVVAENVRASVYLGGNEPVVCQIKIMGDPDLITQNFGIDKAAVDPSISTTMNIWDGQVLMEIVFNTATDYQDDGLLDVTDKVRFYETRRPKELGINGIVFTMTNVRSTFSRGTFTQVINAAIVPETLLIHDETGDQPSGEGRDSNANNPNREDPVEKAKREAENAKTRDEVDRAINNADWDAAGKQTQQFQRYNDDDRMPPSDTNISDGSRYNDRTAST